MGKLILQLLQEMYGSKFVRDLIGTRTNVVKPQQFDRNAPTKSTYSKDAFNDPKLVDTIEEKLIEYAPFQITNRSRREQENYLENLKRLRDARKKQQGITEQMETVKEVKPGKEAEVFDIGTKQKVKPQGIETLKSEVGLPKGVEPGSLADRAIQESAQYKMNQQGVKSLLDEDYVPPKTTTIEEDEIADVVKQAEDLKGGIADLEEQTKDMMKLTDEMGNVFAKSYSAGIEGRRRAVMRQVLLRDDRLNLPEEIRQSLDYMKDLSGQEFRKYDPLELADKYYKRDIDKLEELDFLTTQYDNPIDAADTFNIRTPLQLKDEAEDLGKKLKEADDDPDMPEMAEGGRIGYAVGTGLKIAKFFSDKGLDLARELKKAVDDIFPSGDRKLDADVVVDNMLEDLGVDRDMFDQKDISELYGMAYDTLSEGSVPRGLAAFTTKKGKGEVKMADEVEVSQDVKDKIDYNRQRMEDDFTKEMAPKLFLRMELKARFPGITDDMISKIMADDNPQRIAEVLASMDEGLKMMEKGMSTDEIINTFKKTPRTKQAGGGLSYLMGL
jgi:hypothetical protein